jgi:hypothetical protein
MQKDTTLIDNVKHVNAMIHLITSIDDESKPSYCKMLAIPQLTQMGIKVKDTTVKGVLSAMYIYKSKHSIGATKKGADIEEIDVSIPTAKWEKFKNKYEYYKNSDIVGIVEILDSTHSERYKWSTDKGVGFEKYLYKAQLIVERTV